MLRKVSLVLVAAVFAATSAITSAEAQGKGKGKGKGKGRTKVVFVDSDRGAVRGYWHETYGRGNCPPGLAKKHNGCLPPGQAKKRYVVGRRLPTAIAVEPVPTVLVRRLVPVPTGHQYVVVDGDVLLMATATRLVVDAIANAFD